MNTLKVLALVLAVQNCCGMQERVAQIKVGITKRLAAANLQQELAREAKERHENPFVPKRRAVTRTFSYAPSSSVVAPTVASSARSAISFDVPSGASSVFLEQREDAPQQAVAMRLVNSQSNRTHSAGYEPSMQRATQQVSNPWGPRPQSAGSKLSAQKTSTVNRAALARTGSLLHQVTAGTSTQKKQIATPKKRPHIPLLNLAKLKTAEQATDQKTELERCFICLQKELFPVKCSSKPGAATEGYAHKSCYAAWITIGKHCPLCRSKTPRLEGVTAAELAAESARLKKQEEEEQQREAQVPLAPNLSGSRPVHGQTQGAAPRSVQRMPSSAFTHATAPAPVHPTYILGSTVQGAQFHDLTSPYYAEGEGVYLLGDPWHNYR